MKRLTALLLVILICIPALAMTGCKDPLKAKGEELALTKNKMGDAYYEVILWTELAGVYTTDETISAKCAEWKDYIKDAGDVVDLWLDLNEEQMDQYIAEWTATTAEMQAIIDQYKIVEETTVADTTAAE